MPSGPTTRVRYLRDAHTPAPLSFSHASRTLLLARHLHPPSHPPPALSCSHAICTLHQTCALSQGSVCAACDGAALQVRLSPPRSLLLHASRSSSRGMSPTKWAQGMRRGGSSSLSHATSDSATSSRCVISPHLPHPRPCITFDRLTACAPYLDLFRHVINRLTSFRLRGSSVTFLLSLTSS